MGAAFRDYDNDLLPDLWITALDWETFPLFHNEGGGLFEDVTYPTGVSQATIKRSAWSLGMFDSNNDGWKDCFVPTHTPTIGSNFGNQRTIGRPIQSWRP